jgi:type II secretory ATPase GspE/PulE/Tfp pilus assembly ATPase PilB-like protein
MVKDFIASMFDRRVDAAILDFTADSVQLREQVDGVWRADDALDRERGDLMLAVMKQLSALNPDERRKPQAGKFGVVYQKKKLSCVIACQGAKTGERASVKLDFEKPRFSTLAELGMRESLIGPFLEALGGDQGLVLFSSPPGEGLTTLMDVAMQETDRLLRHFVAIESKSRPERYIENLEVTTFDKAAGESPMTVLPKLIRTYPDVIVLRDLDDGAVAELLSKQVAEKRLIITSIRAKSAPEAMLRVLALKVPRGTFATALTCVVNARLVRKLCTECRVGFEPTAEMLKKLGLPKDKVQAMYREPKPEERDKPCKECDGVGYIGRTGIYQILMVNDVVRNTLVKEPRMEAVNKAARAAQMRTLQEEGILLVAKGATSIQEIMRVLK